jgi:calmodulin
MGATLNLVKLNANEDNDIEKRNKELEEKEKTKYGEIDSFFYKYDINGDHELGSEEFQMAIKSYMELHPDKKTNMQELINDLEVKSGDKVCLDDFRKIMIAYLSDDVALENIIDVYRCFDKNLHGAISQKELIHVFSKLGLNISNEEANELVGECDSNSDKHIDFEEFLKIMISK